MVRWKDIFVKDEEMEQEKIYAKQAGYKHLKALGQFFTPKAVAEFMCNWAGKNAKNMLDPAAGNSVFLCQMNRRYPQCQLRGYEIDTGILDFFGNPSGAEMILGDYLTLDWQEKYQAIVGNPPYNKFQAVDNRLDIFNKIYAETGIHYSGNSNLYALFLIKSIYQLAPQGRLAYIIPSEFLNSAYGTQLKKLLLRQGLLRCIINFRHNEEVFPGANTTCCIIFLQHENKKYVDFYNLSSIEELAQLDVDKGLGPHGIRVAYNNLKPEEKWRPYLHQETQRQLAHLVPIEKYCRIGRGIATGANDFFCLSRQQAEELKIDEKYLQPCLCRSRDVKGNIWQLRDWQTLADKQGKAYLLNIQGEPDGKVLKYLRQGQAQGLDKRYLLSKRHPWYSMEQKPVAPILISSAYRKEYKLLRNLARTANLTAFHGIFIRKDYEELTDIIFCYFLTATARELVNRNRKELGRGLEKLQPGDLQQAEMLDIEILGKQARSKILTIYDQIIKQEASQVNLVNELEEIFSPYYCTNLEKDVTINKDE